MNMTQEKTNLRGETPPEKIPLASNPETLTADEIVDALEKGGPWITVEFESNDRAFKLVRVMPLEEADSFYASLGEEIERAKAKYNIQEKP
jgi:hypothetical protein